MNIDQASRIIVKPYITEKTFAMVENESKICFRNRKNMLCNRSVCETANYNKSLRGIFHSL